MEMLLFVPPRRCAVASKSQSARLFFGTFFVAAPLPSLLFLGLLAHCQDTSGDGVSQTQQVSMVAFCLQTPKYLIPPTIPNPARQNKVGFLAGLLMLVQVRQQSPATCYSFIFFSSWNNTTIVDLEVLQVRLNAEPCSSIGKKVSTSDALSCPHLWTQAVDLGGSHPNQLDTFFIVGDGASQVGHLEQTNKKLSPKIPPWWPPKRSIVAIRVEVLLLWNEWKTFTTNNQIDFIRSLHRGEYLVVVNSKWKFNTFLCLQPVHCILMWGEFYAHSDGFTLTPIHSHMLHVLH